jgi:hypothetical protein
MLEDDGLMTILITSTMAALLGMLMTTVCVYVIFWSSPLSWQSELLSTDIFAIVSIFLRFRGSRKSKPVAAPYSKAGE